MSSCAVYWIRNDHRLDDNKILRAFCKSPAGFCVSFTPQTIKRAGDYRRRFYEQSLGEFHSSLRAQGLNTCHSADTVFGLGETFFTDNFVSAIYYSQEPGVEERQEEQHVEKLAQKFGIKTVSIQQDTLILAEDLPFNMEQLPQIFTEFRKCIEKDLKIRPPQPPPVIWPHSPQIKGFPETFSCLNTPAIPSHPHIEGGESFGQRRLQEYFWKLDLARSYKLTRNGMIHWNDSTKFSPWLGTGNISARRIYSELQNYEASVEKNESTYWIFFELLWRDYFHFYCQKQGARLFTSQKNDKENLKHLKANKVNESSFDKASSRGIDLSMRELESDISIFKKWCSGTTGDHFIDSNMRELLLTGWMSNRGRQNVASFLAKQIKLPWTWGAQWFEKLLIDYDVANNWGNWSYFSGVGTDPRDRAFNTQTQAKHYDPQGEYQQYWLKQEIHNEAQRILSQINDILK